MLIRVYFVTSHTSIRVRSYAKVLLFRFPVFEFGCVLDQRGGILRPPPSVTYVLAWFTLRFGYWCPFWQAITDQRPGI